MFAMLFANFDPLVVQEARFAAEASEPTMLLSVVFIVMLLMGLAVLGGVVAVVCLIVWLCRRGSSDNGLKQTITEQQTQIDDMKRELEEVKRKLEG